MHRPKRNYGARQLPFNSDIRPHILALTPGTDPAAFVQTLETYADEKIRSHPNYNGHLPQIAVMEAAQETSAVVWCTPGILRGLKNAFSDTIRGSHPVNDAMLKAAKINGSSAQALSLRAFS